MEVFTIDITSWTASFRYPNFMTSYHPTLEVPPLSTVLGLVNAAAGKYIEHRNLTIGYFFDYEAKAAGQFADVETIHKIGTNANGFAINKITSEPIRREFLVQASLRLYIVDEQLVNFFNQPYYPLLLGRMNDLATVEKIGRMELQKVLQAEILKGQVIPMRGNFLSGQIQPLPQYFTDTFPRRNLGTEPYTVLSPKSKPISGRFEAFRDIEKQVDIFFHHVQFDENDYR